VLRAFVCWCWFCRGGGERDQRARHADTGSVSLQPNRSSVPPCSGQSRPSPSGGREDAASLDRPCARRLRDLAVGMEECSRRGSNQRMEPRREREAGIRFSKHSLAAVSNGMFAEQVELPWGGATSWRDRLVVTAYLSKVCRLELQGEFHQGVCNVSGSFIGDGVFGRIFWALARHRGRSRYSSISSFMRKLLPSMMTVSAWCSTRSRMAEVRVLSLLKICDQCL